MAAELQPALVAPTPGLSVEGPDPAIFYRWPDRGLSYVVPHTLTDK